MTDTDTPPPTPEEPPTPKTNTKKAGDLVDKASTAVDSANTVLSTIKWLCIAIVVSVFAFIGYKAVQLVSKPAAAVGDAVGDVSEAVKSGTENVKQGTSELMDRLVVSVTDGAALSTNAEAAFVVLNEMPVSEPEGMKDRLFRASSLGGSEGRVCKMELDFGNGAVPVFLAADNEAYTTSKALGSKDNRLIRMVIMAGDDEVSLNTSWDQDSTAWVLKWKATTVKKPVGDALAETRVQDVLKAASENCR